MLNTALAKYALKSVNASGCAAAGLTHAYDHGLVEVDPMTGYYRVSAAGAEMSDEAAWEASEPKSDFCDLVAFDPSKF